MNIFLNHSNKLKSKLKNPGNNLLDVEICRNFENGHLAETKISSTNFDLVINNIFLVEIIHLSLCLLRVKELVRTIRFCPQIRFYSGPLLSDEFTVPQNPNLRSNSMFQK